MNRDRRLKLFGVLVIGLLWWAQFSLRPRSRGEDSGALEERFRGASQMIFTAGFRPLVVQYLWSDFVQAYADGRPFEALTDLQVLVRADPDNARAICFMASIMTLDLADREAEPRGKMDRILEGIRALEWAERRKRLRDDPQVPFTRGMLLRRAWVQDRRLARLYIQSRGRSAQEDAWRAFRRAFELEPGKERYRLEAARAARVRAIELIHERRGSAALALFDEAVRIARGSKRGVQTALANAWQALGLALARGPETRFPDALTQLIGVIEALPTVDEGGDASEELFVWSILGHVFRVAETSASKADPQIVAAILATLHRAQSRIEGRLRGIVPLAPPLSRMPERWLKVVATLKQRAPQVVLGLAEKPPPGC